MGYAKLPQFPYAGDKWTVHHEAQREALFRYLDFVVARWGAQVDVWSLTNEQRGRDGWINITAEYLRKIDPYKHPISVSWNRPELDDIDVNSVHWYLSNPVEGEDLDVCSKIEESLSANKPVYFTESGNAGHNWDVDSHVRMRIRTWTAFFKGAVLIWWNTASTRKCHPCGGGNMYLGSHERGYQKVYKHFVEQMTDPAVQQFNLTVPEGVRAYGLRGSSSDESTTLMVYVHHFSNHTKTTSGEFVFPTSGFPSLSSCTGEWVYPENGTSTLANASNDTAIVSPPFKIDIALVVVCTRSSAETSKLLI